MNDSPAVSGAVTIHVVQAGDSLSKLAAKFLGDAARYPEIATRNNIEPQSILTIGQKLIIPAASVTVPASPGGSVPAQYGGEIIETVTTTATRIVPFYRDWRFWLAVGGAAGLIWFLSRRK
jgi:hypothetical protein